MVFKRKLYRFEYVRIKYEANKTGDSFFHFIDHETGAATPAFAKGFHLGSAFVNNDSVKDLVEWYVTPHECAYSRDRYSAPHALRYLDGYYYDFYLEAFNGYETHVVRSRDLIHWESSPLNPVLCASEEDKKIANPELTAEQRRKITAATDINNSDIDFCEFNGSGMYRKSSYATSATVPDVPESDMSASSHCNF